MHDLVLKNAKTFLDNKIKECEIGIDNSKISAIKKNLKGEKEINCRHKIVFPGLIDVHVHFREPGHFRKEDWRHASKAALSGGITTVLDMPNNVPPTICRKSLLQKNKKISLKAAVDYGFFLGATEKTELKALEKTAGLKIYTASTTGNLLLEGKEKYAKAISTAASAEKITAVHAEDNSIIKKNTEKAKNKKQYCLKEHYKIRSAKAEATAIKNIIQAGGKNSIHICHVSSALGVQEIKKAKKQVSCGVTPNHLFLTNKDVERIGMTAKINPSIKTPADRKALWNALNAGWINLIESDHAPHLIEEKNCAYENAASGAPGIETMLPLLLDAYSRKLISLKRIFECCCATPAKTFNLNKGKIAIGMPADFCIANLKKTQVLGKEIYSKCDWSLFTGKKAKGVIETTILRGKICFDSGEFEKIKGVNLFE